MRIAFSWDDGSPQDLKLIKLHEKYDIPGMFFVPTRNSEGREVLTPEQIRSTRSELITFGGHTENHVYLTTVDSSKIEEEIVNNQKYLEDILGEEIIHFCLPGGKYNQEILNTAFKYYKTIRTADTFNFHRNENNIIFPTFHVYPRTYKSRVGNCLRHKSYRQLLSISTHPQWSYLQVIEHLLEREKNSEDDIIIWGHSWEIEAKDLWKDVEGLFKLVSGKYRNVIKLYSELTT